MTAAAPWVAFAIALFGFFGLLLKVRVAGDPALWARIEALEKRLDDKDAIIAAVRNEFDAKLAAERADCDRRLAELEGEIRAMQMGESVFGTRPLAAPLRKAFPVKRGARGKPDHDADLLRKIK